MRSFAVIGRFFASSGSMDGGMIRILLADVHSGAYCGRENTSASPFSMYWRRNSHPLTDCWFGVSRPICERQATRTPACLSGSTKPAVCGSCSSTRSPGRTRREYYLAHRSALSRAEADNRGCVHKERQHKPALLPVRERRPSGPSRAPGGWRRAAGDPPLAWQEIRRGAMMACMRDQLAAELSNAVGGEHVLWGQPGSWQELSGHQDASGA
jgi:hypothetical protein